MKKLITLVASLLAVALLTVPVFAAENQSLAVDITKISISNEANNDLLNAATESSPVNGTRITTWDNTGHATQRWDYSESVPGKPQHYWLKNSANRSYAVTCYGTDGQQVTLYVFGDARVISREVALCIRCEETHPRRTAILQIRIQEVRGFSRAAPRHHHCMDIVAVHKRRHTFAAHFTAHHQPLYLWKMLSPSPRPRPEPHPVERAPYFPLTGKPCRPVLPVSHRPSLDAVQAETRAVRNGRHQQQDADAQQQKHRRFLP